MQISLKAIELKALIDSLTQDIDFEYHGKQGSICPFSRADISLAYDGEELTVESVEAAMTSRFIEGRSLAEVCEELTL